MLRQQNVVLPFIAPSAAGVTTGSTVAMTDETPFVVNGTKAAVVLFPPRPRAIVTLLHSPEFLPGTQTLLYSLRQTSTRNPPHHSTHHNPTLLYPPEIVVLVTPNVLPSVYQDLCSAALCTRILPVAEWHPPSSSFSSSEPLPWERTLDHHCPGWTKLHLFGLQPYETILYIDSDCLVVKDVSRLLQEPPRLDNDDDRVVHWRRSPSTDSTAAAPSASAETALMAAAPDILPPHHFNSGVMVLRPSTKVMSDMKQRALRTTTTTMNMDRSDTAFLNAYFDTWNTEFPPTARLPIGYNAQQVLYDMTVEEDALGGRTSRFWETQVAPNLYIVHYSNPIKPWQRLLDTNETSSSSSLQILWETWYTKSQNFMRRHRHDEVAERRRRKENVVNPPSPPSSSRPRPTSTIPRRPPAPSAPQDSRHLHRLIAKRFKELKRQGKSSKDAMETARLEYGQGSTSQEEMDPGMAVAAMFGMR